VARVVAQFRLRSLWYFTIICLRFFRATRGKSANQRRLGYRSAEGQKKPTAELLLFGRIYAVRRTNDV